MAEAAREYPSNRLIHESSPYLLQHAHNPVDWYPWGAEAFERARSENKPVFLSIGYAACHWCHVMERESFENQTVAAYLNAHFVSIKVDREERPDVDAIYMQALQLMSGQGGWPMSMFLSPEGKPFFGGTYFPPEDQYGRPGFMWLLKQIVAAWRDQTQEIADSGTAIMDAVAREPVLAPRADDETAIISRAITELTHQHDIVHGGFGNAPKFPMTMGIDLLLREYAITRNSNLLDIADRSLDHMSRGGIYDHIGGGFHRYSVDREWLVPHFEKMLYDNALLVPVYLDIYRANGKKHWLQVASDTLDWVLREMTDPKGGFYSTLDADSGGVEGAFYVWRQREIDAALAPDDAALFKEYYDVGESGNWHERRGVTILNVPNPLEKYAPMHKLDPDEVSRRLDRARKTLRAVRERRPRPGCDDKVIAAWNGMMISALAQGTQVLGDARYAEAGRRAADFMLGNMRNVEGDLLHAWRAGRAGVGAFLEDYALLIQGLIDLYETLFDVGLIDEASRLTARMIELFHDAERGGFFMTDGRDPTVIARIKDYYDTSIPSGNSAAALALMRLSILTGREDWAELARRTISAAGSQLSERPLGHLALVSALAFETAPPLEVAISGDPRDVAARELIETAWREHLPARVLAAGPEGSVAMLKYKPAINDRPTAYVCRNQTCHEPVHDRESLRNQLADR